MPPPDKVETLLNDLFNDLDIFGKQRETLMQMSISQKWGFLQKQNIVDRSAQSPQWLIKQLRENFSIGILKEIQSRISVFRLSWCKQFCELNGHLSILTLLAKKQAEIDFDLKEDDSYQIVTLTLSIIRAICDSKFTRFITSQNKSLFTIMNSINPNPNIIISIFTILIKFIFECDNEEKQFKTTNKIIRYFHDLDQQGKNAWEIISFILASIENEKKFNDENIC